ncbi:MAG: hypothetical protein JW888_00255, partial [Pirellulales bacterium]|nr:hypothetical protein [Pirellulales bacterium]
MFELAKCPACGKFAAGLSEWTSEQVVRCPHCLAEFTLRSAVVQSLPQLILASDTGDKLPDSSAEGPPAAVSEQPAPADSTAAGSTSETDKPGDADDDLTTAPGIEADRPVAATGHSADEADIYAIRPMMESKAAPGRLPRVYANAYDFLPEEKKK